MTEREPATITDGMPEAWPVNSIWTDAEGRRYTLRGFNDDGLVVLAPHRDLRLRHCWNAVAFERNFTRVEVP
jgi:hypothetical protein